MLFAFDEFMLSYYFLEYLDIRIRFLFFATLFER